MEEIRIMEKPEWISWQEVQDCITVAQKTNNKKGFDMLFGHSTGEKLKENVGDGYCFVALNNNNEVVGTVSLIMHDLNFWWYKGTAGLQGYEGILPEYRGSDVYFDLHDMISKKVSELGLKVIYATTADQNSTVKKLCQKQGWKIMQYSPTPKHGDYYSVIMAKWQDFCPYSDRRIYYMFHLSKMVVRILYKVKDSHKVNRLFFWK